MKWIEKNVKVNFSKRGNYVKGCEMLFKRIFSIGRRWKANVRLFFGKDVKHCVSCMKLERPQFMSGLIQRAKEYYTERMDQRIVKPRSTMQMAFFVIYQLVFFIVGIWIIWWLPQVDIESARWALSAQAQASGVILGLLVAAMIFRWSIITNQEEELRNKVHLYFKELAVHGDEVKPNVLNRFPVDIAYDEYISCINQGESKLRKKMKKALSILGRFWVIKSLALKYSIAVDKSLGRDLRQGEIKELVGVSKLSGESAVDMWDNYFASPARFVLQMHDALQYVSRMLAIHRKYGKRTFIRQAIRKREIPLSWSPVKEYKMLERVLGLMRGDDTWLRADEITRWRSRVRPLFYIACGFLFLATILAVTILTGFGGFESLLADQPGIFLFLVGFPIGCAILGAYNCILIIFVILR